MNGVSLLEFFELADHGFGVHLVLRFIGIPLPEHEAMFTAQVALVGDVHHCGGVNAINRLCLFHSLSFRDSVYFHWTSKPFLSEFSTIQYNILFKVPTWQKNVIECPFHADTTF